MIVQIMKKNYIFLLALLAVFQLEAEATRNSHAAHPSAATAADPSKVSILDLKATPPKGMAGFSPYKTQVLKQVNYFFARLPQVKLPDEIITEIKKTYGPMMPLLSPIDSSQTQEERGAQVMSHLLRFYGLLYLIAEEEALEKQVATVGTGSQTSLRSGDTANLKPPTLKKPLTAAELKASNIWQNHLRILIASSYGEEVSLLKSVHKHETTMFSYLPQFEIAYHDAAFKQVRYTSELTRLYLLLVNRIRERSLSHINQTSDATDSWGVLLKQIEEVKAEIKTAPKRSLNSLIQKELQLRNQLFHEIAAFQESPFYSITMRFENLDWNQKFPIRFFAPSKGSSPQTPISFQEVLKSGYDFDQYFTYDPKTKEVAISNNYELIFTLEKGELYLTALGNMLFTGNVSYRKVSLPQKRTLYIGSFDKIKANHKNNLPAFDKFFATEEKTEVIHGRKVKVKTNVPTLGMMELLCFTGMKLLFTDTSELFEAGNLKLTFEKMVPTDLPNFLFNSPDDYLILDEINTLTAFFTNLGVEGTKVKTMKPQGWFSSACNWVVGAADTVANKITSAADKLANATTKAFDKLSSDIQHQDEITKDRFEAAGHWLSHNKADDWLKGQKWLSKTDGWIKGQVWHGIVTEWSKAKKDMVNAFYSAIKGVRSFGYSVYDGLKAAGNEALAFYYGSCVLPMLFQGMSPDQSLKRAQHFQHRADTEMKACGKSLQNMVNSIGAVAQDISEAGAAVASMVLSNHFGNMWDAVSQGFVTYMQDTSDMAIEITQSTIMLTAEAVQIGVSMVGGAFTGALFTKSGWESIGSEWKDLGENIASAVLSCVSLLISGLEAELKQLMLTIGYFINTLTDIVIEVAAIVATAFYYGWKDGWNNGFAYAQGQLDKHKRLIAGLVTCVVLVTAMVLTGGAASALMGGLLVLSLIQMGMSIAGDVQADKAAMLKQAAQKRFLSDYKAYVINNASVITNFNTQKAIEELLQLETETMNQERSLLYYQNYLNSIFNATLSAESYQNGLHINNQLRPGATGVMTGDLGSLYGIQTGRMNLSPANGFPVYNAGRKTYSQEAALEPMVLPGTTKKGTTGDPFSKKNPVAPKSFWFQQKDLSNIPAGKPLHADILWRSIYEYDGPFYIGIYLTERSLDTAAVNNAYANLLNTVEPTSGTTTTANFDAVWQTIDTISQYLLDYDHLAKMFVCYREAAPGRLYGKAKLPPAKSIPKLGVYVHEAPATSPTANTKGWLNESFPGISFKRGTWYRMKATLAKENLELYFWEVGSDEDARKVTAADNPPANAISKVTSVNNATIPSAVNTLMSAKNFAGSMGVITSGASVEYIVISPQEIAVVEGQGTTAKLTTITGPQEANSRLTANKVLAEIPHMAQSEREQGQAWHTKINEELDPTFGKFKLTALSRNVGINSEFVYATKGTFSPTTTDYVVFTTNGQNSTATEIGVSPVGPHKPVALLSLVSGTLYSASGAIVGHLDNAAQFYEQQHPALSSSVLTKIKTAQDQFWKLMSGPFVFENMTLAGDGSSMGSGAFVYTMSTGADKPKFIDYFVMASTNALGINKTGQLLLLGSTTSKIDCIVSLVTNKVYNLTLDSKAPTIITSKNLSKIKVTPTDTIYDAYSNYETKLNAVTKKAILASQKIYRTELTAQTADKKLEAEASHALNAANTAATSANNEAVWATGSLQSKLQTNYTATKKAATTLKAALSAYKKSSNPQTETALKSAVKAAEAITKTTEANVKLAEDAPPPSNTGTGPYGGTSNSPYGYGSSYQNYNTSSYGSYNSSYGYGSPSGGFGENGESGGGTSAARSSSSSSTSSSTASTKPPANNDTLTIPPTKTGPIIPRTNVPPLTTAPSKTGGSSAPSKPPAIGPTSGYDGGGLGGGGGYGGYGSQYD